MSVGKKSKKSLLYVWIVATLSILSLSVFLLSQRLWKGSPQASGLNHYATITKVRVSTNNCNPKIQQYTLVVSYVNSKKNEDVIGIDSFTVSNTVTTGMYLTEYDSSSNVIANAIYEITAFDENGQQLGEARTIRGNANSPLIPESQPTVYITVPCNF